MTPELREHEIKAKAILRESADRTPAEAAAIAVLDEQRWVLWHADDYSLGVIRLLSNARLLLDKEDEQRKAKADKFWSAHSEQKRAADSLALARLGDLALQAADRLESGADPVEVAQWLRATPDKINQARESSPAEVSS